MNLPSGLAPILVDQVEKILLQLKEQKITILLVEQNANMALDIADYAYVMETGGIILEGPCSELRKDEKVDQSLSWGVGIRNLTLSGSFIPICW